MAENIKIVAGSYTGQLLIATQQIAASCFMKSVVYVCSHSPEGAMGVMVNRAISNFSSEELLKQLKLDIPEKDFNFPVYYGGPVESGTGFVLHSSDYQSHNSLHTQKGLSLTSNLEILEDIAQGKGPEKMRICLGYSGWSAGQLDNEIKHNHWFSIPRDDDLIFSDVSDNDLWQQACESIGVNSSNFSQEVGNA